MSGSPRQDDARKELSPNGTAIGFATQLASRGDIIEKDPPSVKANSHDIAPASTGFHSILFDDPAGRKEAESRAVPRYFIDLNLDQIVDAIVSGKEEYNLKPFFYAPLTTVDAITYRHEVMRDLEVGTLLEHISAFAQSMRFVREYRVQINKLHYQRQKESWFLDAVALYCDAVNRLSGDLDV